MVFAGQDHWRKHPMVTGCYKGAFPGVRVAAVLVGGYCVVNGVIKLITAPAPPKFEPGLFKFEAAPDADDDDDE